MKMKKTKLKLFKKKKIEHTSASMAAILSRVDMLNIKLMLKLNQI